MKSRWFTIWIAVLIVLNIGIILVRSLSFPANDRTFLARITDYIDYQINYDSGLISLALNQRSDALQSFRKAWHKQPHSLSCRMHLTRLLQWQGSRQLNGGFPDLAAPYFRELYSLDPVNPVAVLFRLSESPENATAGQMLTELKKANPRKDWQLAIEITDQWLQYGTFSSEFSSNLSKITLENPSVAWTGIIEGDIHWMNRRYNQARTAYLSAMTTGANNRFLSLRLGILSCLTQNHPDRTSQFLQVVQSDKDLFRRFNEVVQLCCPKQEPEISSEVHNDKKPIQFNLRHEQEIMLSHMFGFWSFLDHEIQNFSKPSDQSMDLSQVPDHE